MATSAMLTSELAAIPVPRRTIRPTGTDLAPRWRGRLHLGALIVSLPAAALLISRDREVSVTVYAVGLVSLFAVSAGYHLLPVGAGPRCLLRRADHAMIYLFTAAAYTPYCVRVVAGTFGTVMLALVWLGALGGVVMKVLSFSRATRAGSVLYFLLGCLGVVALPDAARVLSSPALWLMLAMGACYSAGAAVLFTRRPDPIPHLFGYHEVWHAAVVAASACYFAVVWGFPPGHG